MFEIASTVSQVNQTFYFIFAVCVFFIVAITGVMIYFVVRYSRARNPVATDIEGIRWMEITWTTIPTLLTLGMFYYGWLGFMGSSRALEGATEITVVARKYNWMFKYPNGKILTELYVAAGRPVKANLTTEDVIHSFFIPAFRIKEDCVPGQTNLLTFTPLTEGTYDIYCTEYCGAGHATMLSRVVAMRPKDYDIWYHSRESQKPINLKEALAGRPELLKRGEMVFKTNCVSCHGPNGEGGLVANARNFRILTGWKNGDKISQMFRTVTTGLAPNMPSFAHLPAEDRLAAILHVRNFATGHAADSEGDIESLDKQYSLSKGAAAPPEIPIFDAMKKIAAESGATSRTVAAAPLSNASFAALMRDESQGAALYAGQCARCHGERGGGDIPVAALDEVFGARLRSLALNTPGRGWRAGGVQIFRKRIEETSVATGGIKPSFAALGAGDWEALYRFCLRLAPQ